MRKRVLPTCRPASIFVLLSLAFGSIIIFANPPLRGPDEIAHFLRIYSYARGELLPATEINARKGILVSPELYNQLYFFKTAGEVFARSREEGMRYGQIMAEYSKLADAHGHETEPASMFTPFAGTEGYNPVAYIPYIVAAAIGRLLRLDLPDMLLLMRFFGLLAFTAVAACAIAVTPALKWAFVLIAMLPVSLYNRQAVAGAHWDRGLAGYSTSALDLSCTHCAAPACAASKTAAGGNDPYARDGYHRTCRPGLRCPRVSDLFSRLYAHRHGSCSGRPGTLFRDRAPRGCDIHRCRSQPRTATWHARSDCDCRLNDRRNHDRRSGTASALVNEWPHSRVSGC
jgi:predicted membrane protein DUF2142